MAFLGIFKRKDARINHDLDDSDREKATDTIRYKAELRRLDYEHQKALREIELRKAQYELEKLRLELDGDDEEEEQNPMDTIALALLAKFAGNGQSPSPVVSAMTTTTSGNSAEVELSDEQIADILKKIPSKYLKIAKTMSDDNIRAIAKSHLGNLSLSSLDRVVMQLKAL